MRADSADLFGMDRTDRYTASVRRRSCEQNTELQKPDNRFAVVGLVLFPNR